jgi:hypothetical protein
LHIFCVFQTSSKTHEAGVKHVCETLVFFIKSIFADKLVQKKHSSGHPISDEVMYKIFDAFTPIPVISHIPSPIITHYPNLNKCPLGQTFLQHLIASGWTPASKICGQRPPLSTVCTQIVHAHVHLFLCLRSRILQYTLVALLPPDWPLTYTYLTVTAQKIYVQALQR